MVSTGIGEEHLIGTIPSREGNDCDEIDEDSMPTWAQLMYLLNNIDAHTIEIIFVGCGIYSTDTDPQSDNGVGGWSGIVTKQDVLRVPFGSGVAVFTPEILENVQDWSYTAEYAAKLSGASGTPAIH